MRNFTGKLAIIIGTWAIITAIFHLYTAYFGTLEPRLQRAVHLTLLLPMAFLAFPAKKNRIDSTPSFMDWVLAIMSMLPSLYLIINSEMLKTRVELVDQLTTVQIFLGCLVVMLVLEACRRAVSGIFAGTIVLVIIYMFVAPYLPGILNSREYSVARVSELMFLSTDNGVYGFLTGIGSNIIFVFILFAAIMIRSGVGQFFMDLSIMIAGRFRGGPAKVAVLSSGLYGSISGSSVADVYSTGSFTIPLMKKIGYRPANAGAIEAVACAGGPLLPPVMGAGAFIMAEMTSTSYLVVIQAAVLGALIYYIGVISTVHFEAVAEDIKPVPMDWNVGWKNVLKRSPLVIPFVIMVYLLVGGISPAKASVAAILTMLVLWILMERTKFKISLLIKGLEYATKSGAVIAAALAGAGILVAIVNQTGLALTIGNKISEFSFGIQSIALFLVMITVLLLGAGIPSTPAYIITVTIAAGALSAFDLPILSIHLFIFYFAILADITPPVGVTAFAAANISESPPLKTAFLSPRFAFAGFLVPYVFVAHPALLMDGVWYEIVYMFIVTSLAVIGLAAAIEGAVFNKVGWSKRLLLVVISITMISSISIYAYVAVLCFFLFFIREYMKIRDDKAVSLTA